MLALAYIESGICVCGCGLPREVAHDKTRNFATQPTTCHARKWLAVAQRDAAQLALPIKDRDPKWKQGVPFPEDGVLWSVFEHTSTPDIPEVHRD